MLPGHYSFGSIADPPRKEDCTMLIEFRDVDGSPVYVNPQYVIAVREEKHFGRPGVGASSEYRDTLILTTKGDFNVQDPLDTVAREIDRATQEMPDPKPADIAASVVARTPDTEA
jgi:hypothetical protein